MSASIRKAALTLAFLPTLSFAVGAQSPGPVLDVDTLHGIGQSVDARHGSDELVADRANASHASDRCVKSPETFVDAIGQAVTDHLDPVALDIGHVVSPSYDPFKIYANTQRAPVGLMSHPMCRVDRSSLSKVLADQNSAKMPNDATIQRMNRFVDLYNGYRDRALKGDTVARAKAAELWTRLMGCLSYVESLGDADVPRSDRLANQYAPSDYRRPAGVNFYYDPGQPVESALNIGLFQFAPGSGGNIQNCIRRWNSAYPSCAIPRNASSAEMIRTLGAAKQRFNAFCGVTQVLATFYTQANTTGTFGTHPANVTVSGRLKDSSERCVSLHVRTGRAYNHFGPFHNSTAPAHQNLAQLMSCTVPQL